MNICFIYITLATSINSTNKIYEDFLNYIKKYPGPK